MYSGHERRSSLELARQAFLTRTRWDQHSQSPEISDRPSFSPLKLVLLCKLSKSGAVPVVSDVQDLLSLFQIVVQEGCNALWQLVVVVADQVSGLGRLEDRGSQGVDWTPVGGAVTGATARRA